MKYTICKTYKIEYAHRIFNQLKTEYNKEAKCRNIHGHSGVVKIYISSNTLDDQGMVIDFTNLKPIKDYIMIYDHSLIISRKDKEMMEKFFNDKTKDYVTYSKSDRIRILEDNVSSEEIAKDIFYTCKELLSEIKKELNLENTMLNLDRLEFSETDNNMVIVEE